METKVVVMFLALFNLITVTLAAVPASHKPGPTVCPLIKCPGVIPKECRKAEFVIGSDGQTRCQVCDSSLCGPPAKVCPLFMCTPIEIKPECRRPNFVIGTDGITKCPSCSSSVCGKAIDVCPQISCPTIEGDCRMKQFVIGSDGITLCRVCDKVIDDCFGSK